MLRFLGIGKRNHLGDAVCHIWCWRHGDGDGHHHRNDIRAVVPVRRPRLRDPLPSARLSRLPEGNQHVRIPVRILHGTHLPAAGWGAAYTPPGHHAVSLV